MGADGEAGLTVVVGVDFRAGAGEAVREAVRLARLGAARSLHMVHTVEDREGLFRRTPGAEARKLEELPARVREFVGMHGAPVQNDDWEAPSRVWIHVRVGKVPLVLRQVAADVDADLIIVGPHEHGFRVSRALGAIARHLVERAHCPVLVARRKSYEATEASEEIEPPCPLCDKVRLESSGTSWWCESHARTHEPIHIYSGSDEIRWTKPDSQAGLKL